jgi:ribonuclease P protein component
VQDCGLGCELGCDLDCDLMSAAPKRSGKEPAVKARVSFPHAARLLKHSDFDRVYKQGRRHFSPHLTVYYLPQAVLPENAGSENAPPEKLARIGFTVGKVLGGAVERNRIKRRLREAVRLRRALLQGSSAVDVVINPKKSVLKLEFSLLLEEVGRALDTIAKKRTAKEKEK